MTGKRIAVVDIIVYCELQTVCKLYGIAINGDKYVKCNHLAAWLGALGESEVLEEMDTELERVIARERLTVHR